MNVQVEKKENSMAVLTVEVDQDVFDKAVNKVYNAQKGKINIPGFRKGKAPRKVIEKLYGETIFYEDAANDVIDETYSDAADQSGEDIVSLPEITVTQLEPGKPMIYTASVALRPEVKLGKYKGIKAAPIDDEVTEEELNNEIQRQRRLNGRDVDVTDRPVKNEDIVTLDFEGFVDGEAFQGGKGTDYPLTIGSGSFIPGFEEKLIGAEIGKETEVEVTFPEDYHEESLKGKPAVFKCTVKAIREKQLPELDDDYASDISEFETFDEYKADVKETLRKKKEEAAKSEREDKVIQEIVADCDFELPEAMVDSNVTLQLRDYAMRLRYQGLDLAQYMKYTNQTEDDLRAQMRPDVEKRLKAAVVMGEIAKKEGLTLSDEDMDAEIERIAEGNGMKAGEYRDMLSNGQLKEIKENAEIKKAIDFVMDNVKEK